MSGHRNQTTGSGIKVRFKQTKICFFVAYLGLLLNLGPSLHHLDLFGFHTHCGSISCSHHHDDSSHHHADSHCSHSFCDHSHPQPKSSESLTVRSGSADHDCPFCDFFDQYHVIVEPVETVPFYQFALVPVTERPSDVCLVNFNPVARGPPATV